MITFACLHLTRFNHEMNVSEGSKYHGTKSRMATWWLLLLFRAMELTNSNHMTAHIEVGGGQTAPFSGVPVKMPKCTRRNLLCSIHKPEMCLNA